MTGLRIELAKPDADSTPQEYVEKHVAPVAVELHRLVNELMVPGATSAEEWASDMVPSGACFDGDFHRCDERLQRGPKHVTFNGLTYFDIPTKIRRRKKVTVQFTAVVYGKKLGKICGDVAFRLVRADGMVIDNSEFQVKTEEPQTVTRSLLFGADPGRISPDLRDYIIEGRSIGPRTLPVCRRLSLSFVYI